MVERVGVAGVEWEGGDEGGWRKGQIGECRAGGVGGEVGGGGVQNGVVGVGRGDGRGRGRGRRGGVVGKGRKKSRI